MPSAAETIHDLAIHHRIALNRYSTATVHKVVGLLNKIELSAMDQLMRADFTAFSRDRLEELLTEIRSIQAQGWVLIQTRLGEAISDLAANEMLFAGRLAQVAGAPAPTALSVMFSGAPALVQVIAAVEARPFQGRFLKDWLSEAEEGAAKRVRETIRQGFIEGRTTDDLVRALRGTRANRYQDGIIEGSRRGVEAMVRTAITHTATVAQEEVFRAHADVITGLIWTSTLDNRTTLICASRSEKVYPIDEGPRPPAHVNCRSIMRPQVRQIAGVTPFTAPSYSQWLAKQPAAVQDDILGPSRGRLYRQGGLTIGRFVDRAGVTLTLDQLRQTDAGAFERAGL